MPGLSSIGSMMSNPIIGLIVFLAVGAGVITTLSGGQLTPSLVGIFRMIVSAFTAPFAFLRNTLTIIRSAEDAAKDYERTRVYMLFRFNRLNYLAILLVSIFVLAAGITGALISLYPSAEMAQHKALSENIKTLQEQIDTTKKELAEVATPAHRKTLEDARTAAETKLTAQREGNDAFLAAQSFGGPLITQLRNARNPEYVAQLRGQVDSYLSDCPMGYSWQGFTPEQCISYRQFALDYAQRRTTELALAKAFDEADKAFTDVDTAAQAADLRLEYAREQMKSLKEARGEVSLLNPKVIFGKLWAGILLVLGSFAAVIGIVWAGALLIDFFNWVILLMRAAEKEASGRLDHAGKEYE